MDILRRCSVLDAMLGEVERLRPESWESIEEARELLAVVAYVAASPFTQPAQGAIEHQAMTDERDAFARYIREVGDQALMVIEPLPYRRVLEPAEERELRDRLAAQRGIGNGYWYSLEASSRADLVAFLAEDFWERPDRIRAILAAHGATRVWELREFGASYEPDLSLLDPAYTGAEGFWCAPGFDWVRRRVT